MCIDGKSRNIDEFLSSLPTELKKIFKHYVDTINEHVPEAKHGISYGMPALKYKNRPLIGFSVNKSGNNIYPFDPRVIRLLKDELKGREVGKGYIRFSIKKPLSDRTLLHLVDLRLKYLTGELK